MQFRRSSPGYFDTMRIPLLSGRDFAASDGLDAAGGSGGQQAVRGAALARRRSDRPTHPARHQPALAHGGGRGRRRQRRGLQPAARADGVHLRSARTTSRSRRCRWWCAPGRSAGPVPRGARRGASADPAQPIDSVTTLEQFLGDSLGPQRFRSMLLLVLGGIGLALAGLGIYGVTARSVEERSRELGVRLALGATPAGLLRLVVGRPCGWCSSGWRRERRWPRPRRRVLLKAARPGAGGRMGAVPAVALLARGCASPRPRFRRDGRWRCRRSMAFRAD